MDYQDNMLVMNAELIMPRMDFDRIITNADLNSKHHVGGYLRGISSHMIEKLGELLVSTGEHMIHYVGHHDDHHEAA